MKTGQALQKFVKRNSSTILTAVGVVGVVGTAVTAVKATPKAMVLLEEAKKEKGDELTKMETIKVAGPAYIPSIVMGAATIACVIGANVLSKKQQASVMSAYALLDRSYKDYKKKVEELYGEGADIHVRSEIAKDNFTEDDIPKEDNTELFYDEFTKQYVETTPERVMNAAYRINRDLEMTEYAYLVDYCKYLGIDVPEGYESLGWSIGGNYERYWQKWIDFSYPKFELDDGLEVKNIIMQVEPYPNFEEYC